MPNHYGHDRITVVIALLAALLAGYFGILSMWQIVALACATIFGGCMFSPDLDLEGAALRRWGPLACLWWPYTVFFPHRHFLTHGWLAIVSTALRVVYFVCAFLIIPALLLWSAIRFQKAEKLDIEGFVHLMTNTLTSIYALAPLNMWLVILGGLWLGAISHTTADYLVSGWKRMFGGQRRARRRNRRDFDGHRRAEARD